MSYPVLPGPSLAEQARTALAQARTATLSWPPPPGTAERDGTGPAHQDQVTVPVRADRSGRPLLLRKPESDLAERLADQPVVTVTVPSPPPYTGLALRGIVQACGKPDREMHRLTLLSLRFTGARGVAVPLAEYLTAAPDPLWQHAPAVLEHLEHGHMAELLACIRAHGLPQTQWVSPRGLDRYGLQLVTLSRDGMATVRLSFPAGPVRSFEEIPASLRAVLACRCPASRLHSEGH